MQWAEIRSILIMLLLLGCVISLMHQNRLLKKENMRLLEKTGEYVDMENDAKETLKSLTEIRL